MKERPILFSGPMVKAILEGRKTQTRRIVKPQPVNIIPFIGADNNPTHEFGACYDYPTVINKHVCCPYGQPGDRLWVREAHAFVPMPAYRCSTGIYQQINPSDDYEACVYRENFDRARSFPWRPSIHMPRWASRILLEIVSVRVERLQAISEADADREGVAPEFTHPDIDWVAAQPLYKWGFHKVWHEINGAESWDLNPWVWVVEFRKIEGNP